MTSKQIKSSPPSPTAPAQLQGSTLLRLVQRPIANIARGASPRRAEALTGPFATSVKDEKGDDHCELITARLMRILMLSLELLTAALTFIRLPANRKGNGCYVTQGYPMLKPASASFRTLHEGSTAADDPERR